MRQMSDQTISDDIALRIALACRAPLDMDAARLLGVIGDAIGLPPTDEKLRRLKVKDLRMALGGELAGVDSNVLKKAVYILKGPLDVDTDPPPPVDAYAEGNMPNSVRVAFASNGGDLLDGHFGSARHFLVYQVSASENRLIDVRFPDDAQADDKNAYRAGLVGDCQVLYVASIGGPAAAKVIKTGVHPLTDTDGGSTRDRIRKLQTVLGDKAPPWLSKVLGRVPEERVRFEQEGKAP
jgi:nitrogen fixation protein NifX